MIILKAFKCAINKISTIIVINVFLIVIPWVCYANFVKPPFKIDQSQFPPLSDSYIQPNEWFDGVYENDVGQLSGAMISVGTFRAFQKILYGNFKWAIIVDIDPAVAHFNELNYNAITQAKSLKQYLENFPEFYSSQYGVEPKGFHFGVATKEFRRSHSLFDYVEKDIGESIYFVSGKDDPQNSKYFKPFFFSNEKQFQLMKSKLNATNIMSIIGSFTDPKLAHKLNQFLLSQGLSLSLLDLSNVMDYVLPENVSSTERIQFTKGLRGFLQNLSFTSIAKVIFTSSIPGKEIPILQRTLHFSSTEENDDTFRYYKSTPQKLLDILSGGTASADDPKILTLADFPKNQPRKLKCNAVF